MTEETETLTERMRQYGDSGYGDALSMQDLEDKVFQIVGFNPGESEGKWGMKRWNLTQIIIEDGDEAYETEAFLSGNRINRILDGLHADDEFPVRVRITRRGDLQGNPWDLMPADAELPLPLDGDSSLPVAEPDEKPKDSPLVKRAKKAGATEVVTVRRKGGEQTDMPWADFCGLWQGEGYGLDELGDICGATSAQALTHWFAADKGRTITVLKVEATQRRKPLQEEPMAFE